MATERETLVQSKEIFLPELLAQRFVDQFANKGFTPHRLDFGVKSEYQDPDGTRHTTTRPVVAQEISGSLSGSNKFLLEHEDVLGYFIELKTVEHEDGLDYFVGITQVPPRAAYENLDVWTNIVSEARVRHPRYKGGIPANDTPPSLSIASSGYNSIRVEYTGEDINLEKFYEDLQK